MSRYRIVERPAFEVVGKKVWIGAQDNDLFGRFWEQCRQEGLLDGLAQISAGQPGAQTKSSLLGVSCVEQDPAKREFYYLIGIEKPEDYAGELEVQHVPAAQWAVFACVGKVPEAIVESEMFAFMEWLPASGYEHAPAPEMEVYFPGNDGVSADSYCEFWLPVQPAGRESKGGAPLESAMDLHEHEDVAENYDFYVSALVGDDRSLVDFHLELAQEYGQQGILDIACGTGVLLLPFVAHGYRVTGIDISQAMLSVLQRKLARLPASQQDKARLVCANMTDFHLEEGASLAIIARSGYMHLLTPQAQEQALRNIHRHLAPGGILTFNTFDPNYTMISAQLKGGETEFQIRAEYINARGRRERIWNAPQYDPEQQVVDVQWIYEELDEQGQAIGRRKRLLRLRWSFETETRHLLRLCGFRVLQVYSSYTKEPRAYGRALIWVAERL